MPKTITLRVPDNVYDVFKKAATGERRSISNFIEYATLNYLVEETYIYDSEMQEILNDKHLINDLNKGLKDIDKGKVRIIG